MKSKPSVFAMAACACSFDAIVTKAKPRARPVNLSRMTSTVVTSPNWAK